MSSLSTDGSAMSQQQRGVDTVNVAIAAPVVTPSGTTNTFTVGGAAVAVDSGVTVTSCDTDLTGATVTITQLSVGRHAQFHQPERHHAAATPAAC